MAANTKLTETLKINALVRPEVAGLPAYGAGQTLSQAQMARPSVDMVNLSVNENPFGISDRAKQALEQAFADAACYPDSQCLELREVLAEQLPFELERIVVGNGSEDILSMLCKAFIKPGDQVMVAKPTFSLHPIYANMMGAEVIAVPMSADMHYDVEDWLRHIRQAPELKVLMLANPSNPVGCTLDHQGLTACIAACPLDTLIVIDEAYFEFAQQDETFADSLAILGAQSHPWIVLRTFSKAYGLAGLRVGYGLVSDSSIIDYLDRVRTPYNVNRAAQSAAIAVLKDPGYLQKTCALVSEQALWVRAELKSLGLFVAPSQANFLFIDCGRDACQVAGQLLEAGIMVKPWREPGYEHYIRMTIGLEQQNKRFVRALAQILQGD
ncbi:histidinol-phosphate transaminase [Thalassomonas viridans]|uniref:Histidinol-phosphate aminotransferase n=1 Tax=Thalassomonas viridans TaxID=137584 RepID=A0AAF0CE63_9GAMM|nr:histidinol-phosphate transaminase [Thalassomonas viridans]WDE09045.1 histidinol-phosphate transaminase [Thalassomonas viridans]